MNTILKTVVLWKLIIFRGFLYAYTAFCLAYTMTMNSVRWEDLDSTQRSVIIIGLTGTIATSIAAFLDKAMTSIAKGEIPLTIGSDQDLRQRTTTTTDTTIKTTT